MTREEEVSKRVAATGRCYNTGKVLIGSRYVPPPPVLTDEEELIQSALLSARWKFGLRDVQGWLPYIFLVVTVFISILGMKTWATFSS